MGLVISTAILYKLIVNRKTNLKIVDTRSFSEYSNGHIPGAINLELMQYHWNDTSKSGIKNFNKQMKKLFSNIGIAKETYLVFYDNLSGPSAARGVWLSLYFSHKRVAMLDGGFTVWKKENKPIETKTEAYSYYKFDKKPNKKLLATLQTVYQLIKFNDVPEIIDSRSPEEYSGKYIRAARGGHVPYATNIDWINNISNGKFKSRKQLELIYSDFSKNQEIITYCQGGYRAANTFVILTELGFKKVKLYLASWNEWGNNKDLPIELGKVKSTD